MFVHILVQLLITCSRFRYRYLYYYKTNIDFIPELDKNQKFKHIKPPLSYNEDKLMCLQTILNCPEIKILLIDDNNMHY